MHISLIFFQNNDLHMLVKLALDSLRVALYCCRFPPVVVVVVAAVDQKLPDRSLILC